MALKTPPSSSVRSTSKRMRRTLAGGGERRQGGRLGWRGNPLAASRRLAPQRQERAAGACHQTLLVVHHVALREPHRPPALHQAPGGNEPPRPHGFEEVDLELERGEGLALLQRRRVGP